MAAQYSEQLNYEQEISTEAYVISSKDEQTSNFNVVQINVSSFVCHFYSATHLCTFGVLTLKIKFGE